MFKRLTQKRVSNNSAEYLKRISIEYGEILAQPDAQAILFFLPPSLKWEGGLNQAVLELAGPELEVYAKTHIRTPQAGEVFALPPFHSEYKALYGAILPSWDGGIGFEERDLVSCYREALLLAAAQGISDIAVPAMGKDKRDFPHIRFARVALKGILEGFTPTIEIIRIMCIDHTMVTTYRDQLQKLKGKS